MWCTFLPHLVHLLTFLSLVGYVSPPRVCLLFRAYFVTGSEFGWANGVFRQCMRGLREEMMHGCGAQTLPHLVHLLTFLSLVGYVSPRRVSIPCHASFAAGGELGLARAFVGGACEVCVRSCGMGVVH